MPTEKYGVREEEHIPGIVLHRYMTDYAAHFDLTRRIQLRTEVVSAEKIEGQGWKVTTLKTLKDGKKQEQVWECEKLVIGTGLTSSPKSVATKGQESFGKPVLHHGELTLQGPDIVKNPEMQTIAVLGGSKTAYDAVHLFASSGKKVEWIIRKSGHGPTWMAPAHVYLGPMRCWLEKLTTTRVLTWFSPCIWGDADGYSKVRHFLHGTSAGRFIVDKFWGKLRSDIVNTNGYRKDPKMAGLEPNESLLWTAASLAILNYPTPIYDYVRSGQVTVHRKDIDHLSEGTVNFTDGTTVAVDALSAVTGWQFAPTFSFKPDGVDSSLGIPSLNYTPSEKERWNNLDVAADEEIYRRFPYLKKAPQVDGTSLQVESSEKDQAAVAVDEADKDATEVPVKQSWSPYRLYRGIAPPGLTANHDRSLAFIKMVSSTSNMMIVELQSLWSFAYFEGLLDIEESGVEWETALAARWAKRRYPCGFGARYPDFVFDSVPYMDLLLGDLGLNGKRKPTVMKELFEGYSIRDYIGLVEEWKQLKKKELV